MIYVEERRPRPNAYGGSNTGYTRGRGGPTSTPVRGGGDTSRGRGGNMQNRTSSQGAYQKEKYISESMIHDKDRLIVSEKLPRYLTSLSDSRQ